MRDNIDNIKMVYLHPMRIITLCFLIMFTSVAIITPAFANFFNGGEKYYSGMTGAAATVETANPYVSSTGSSSAWPMVTTGVGNQYVQVGWAKDHGMSGSKYFWEFNGDSWYLKWLGDATPGSHNDFMVGRDTAGTWYFKINGDLKGTVSSDTLGWYTGGMAQFYGETWNTSDQCPGKVSNPVTFGNLQYKNSSYSWLSAPLDANYEDLSTMRNNADNGDTLFEIWDTRY